MKKILLLLWLAGCQSVPDREAIVYRAVSAEENAHALKAITECLSQPDCPELLGQRLDCGPFLWQELAAHPAAASVATVTRYTLPQTTPRGSEQVTWEGRRADDPEQVQALWRVFSETIAQKSLQTFRGLNRNEIRIYSALVPGEIREPVFIAEGGGHKILMQLSNGKLSFLDDFRNVAVRD